MKYQGRLGLQQRVLPNYRVEFFDALAEACEGGLGVFAGLPRPVEGITSGALHTARQFEAQNMHLLSGPLYLCYQRGLLGWLRAWEPDALVVEANPRYLATAAAVRWMHERGRRVIGWGLGAPPISGPLQGVRERRRRDVLCRFDALIAYSNRGAAEYARLGYPRERIFVAANAAARRPTEALAPRPEVVDRPSLLFVGRLQRRKRVDALLRACAELPEPKPRLVIVGDGPERRELEALASSVYPQAEFAGAKHGAELRPYFAQADLFVLPGTGGLAIQEAMANGLPVIVAKGDGTQDDLVRSGNGWQITPEDERALRDTIRTALADVGRLRKMGAESYRIVRDEINIEKMVDVFIQAVTGE
jgi:glycosyltransferase involved in cell wall biosynthesis